ncbi:polysaccharide biosynthesis/export family protein [Qingshengfaniella alkalisoli]|nr:polysaccharide biosynthesis/export family protein [Qingshengfaniella alkalisoli]
MKGLGTLATLLIALLIASPVIAQDAEDYRINPGDRLSVAVYGNPDQSGDLQIDATGTVVHPLAGTVRAVDRTLAEIQTEITEKLAEYLPNPTVTVSIAAYSPVFVLGDVEAPGEYAYRPGLNALQLIALAGGVSDQLGLQNGVLDIIEAQRQAEELSVRIFAANVMIERLKSELSGQNFNSYDGVVPPVVTEVDRVRILADERQVFDLRKEQMAAADRGRVALIESYNLEIESLERSVELYEEELALTNEDLDATQSLVDKGLSSPARLREVQRAQSAMHRDLLEVQMYLSRARHGRLEAERQRADSDAVFRATVGEALKLAHSELAQSKLQLQAISKTISTLRIAREQMGASSDSAPRITLTVTRGDGADGTDISITEGTQLLPGDILEVSRPAPFLADITN